MPLPPRTHPRSIVYYSYFDSAVNIYQLAVFRGEDEDPAAVGRFVHVYVGAVTRQPVPVPAVIRAGPGAPAGVGRRGRYPGRRSAWGADNWGRESWNDGTLIGQERRRVPTASLFLGPELQRHISTVS
jgi:hypothetical protein